MKKITKILIGTFTGATAVTGIVAGTAIPVLAQQNQTVEIQTTNNSNDNNGGATTSPNVPQQPTNPQNNSPVPPTSNNPVSSNDNGTNTTAQNPQQPTVSISYSPAEYQKFFEAANSKGETKNGTYKLAKDLSKDVNSANYFGKYYDPIIPQELVANGINVTPENFEIQNNTVVYTYNLRSATVSTTAKVVVSGFYQYPSIINREVIGAGWKPRNLDFLKANLGTNTDRKTFEHFLVDHWNDNIYDDAIKAYRYYYQLDTTKTSKLKKYFDSSVTPQDVIDYSINKITPVYESANGNGKAANHPNKMERQVVFQWTLRGYKYPFNNYMKEPFDVFGQINLAFSLDAKPQLDKNDIAMLTIWDGQANIVWPNPPNPKGYRRDNWSDRDNVTKGNFKIKIFDALWEYFTTNGAPTTKNFLLYFDWFLKAMCTRSVADYGIKP